MKQRFFLLGVLALVSACGKEPVAPVASNEAAMQVAEPNQSECVTAEGYDLLPSNVCLTQRYRFQDQKTYADKQGRERRRVSFRYESSDEQTVVASISQSLRGAGFYARPPMPTTDGSTQIPFTAKERGTLYLVVKSGTATDGGLFIDFLTQGTATPQLSNVAAPQSQ